MNHKDWKNQAIFGRLMESFGYEAPEEEESLEEGGAALRQGNEDRFRERHAEADRIHEEEELEEGEEVVEEGEEPEEGEDIVEASFGKGEPVTARTFEPGKWGATSFKKTGRMDADVPAEPGRLQKDEPEPESFSSRTKARMSARTRASVSSKRGPRGLEQEGCGDPAVGQEDAGAYIELAEAQVRKIVRRAVKKVFKK